MSYSRAPLVDRVGPDAADVEFGGDAPSLLGQLAARGSVRKFRPGADSEEKHEPASDIDTAVVDSLKALDPKRPIREADID